MEMDRIIEQLNRLLPNVKVQPNTDKADGISSTTIELPAAPGSDYYFRLWMEPEIQISALLIARSPDQKYFWYRPFESSEFRNSMVALEAAFCETVEKLLTHETRIIQKNGWLNWHFKCEYRDSSDRWNRIYGHSAFKLGGFKVPKISGRTRTYRSAALVSRT
jgi:hypothetical protein